MAIQRRNKVEVSFSMSSMTDIVFLLLVFFIIASTLITPNALNIVLPQSKDPDRIKKPSATIEVTKDGLYALDGENVNIGNLENSVKALLSDREEKGIILKADKDVPFDFVVKVLDIANRNKYKMVVATDIQK